MADIESIEGETRQYACNAAQDVARDLVHQIEAAIEAIQGDHGKRVRLSPTLLFCVDGTTGMIRAEVTYRQSVSTEARLLPPIPLYPAQTALFLSEEGG
jgi:hypothetical protein